MSFCAEFYIDMKNFRGTELRILNQFSTLKLGFPVYSWNYYSKLTGQAGWCSLTSFRQTVPGKIFTHSLP